MILELFAGARGAGIGISRALPGAFVVGLENDADCCATSARIGAPMIRTDIRTYPPVAFDGQVSGMWASPPCTAFSQAGKGDGRKQVGKLTAWIRDWRPTTSPWEGDPLVWLVTEPLTWAMALRPNWIVCEQVPEVIPIWSAIASRLRGVGYSTWAGKLCAADYGTPQTRERGILLASRLHEVNPPVPTHAEHPHPRMFGEEELPWVSMADALGWGWETPSRTVCGDRGPRWAYGEGNSYATGRVLRTGQNSMVTGRDPEDVQPYERDVDRPAPVVMPNAGRSWSLHTAHAHRPDAKDRPRPVEEPAPTIVLGNDAGYSWRWVLSTGCDVNTDAGTSQARELSAPAPAPAPAVTAKTGTGQWQLIPWALDRPATTVMGDQRIWAPGHHANASEPGQSRNDGAIRVTLEELAVLQDFPPDFPFVGNRSSVARQIGNAVPNKLARACVRAVI